MTLDEVKQKVQLIIKSQDRDEIFRLTKEIEDDGWKVGLFGYRQQVTHTSARRSRLLKNPRWQWRYVAHWYKGDDVVYYYNQRATNKAHAVDFVSRHPLPPHIRTKMLEGVDHKIYFMGPAENVSA